MPAYTFRRHDALRGVALNPNGHVSTRRTLNFRGCEIVMSALLADQLNVKAGNHLAFTYDEDHPDHIYVRTADDADDTRDIQFSLSSKQKDKHKLRCCNTAVVRHVLSQVGAKRSCTCYVSPEPTNIEGKEHYQILLSCPIQIN